MDRRGDRDSDCLRRGYGHVSCVDCADLEASSHALRINQINCQNCALWISQELFPRLCCIDRVDLVESISKIVAAIGTTLASRKDRINMTPIANKSTSKLRKAPQPPLSYPGATPDSDHAKRPSLVEPYATDQELNPGDRVEGLGDFGKPNGEFGTVEQTNEEDAIVKWDDDSRVRLHQPSLRKM